jgi:hypothetical protein
MPTWNSESGQLLPLPNMLYMKMRAPLPATPATPMLQRQAGRGQHPIARKPRSNKLAVIGG